jgi:hypothetical protein
LFDLPLKTAIEQAFPLPKLIKEQNLPLEQTALVCGMPLSLIFCSA